MGKLKDFLIGVEEEFSGGIARVMRCQRSRARESAGWRVTGDAELAMRRD